ncbi:dTDP-4-dehydrorhamnose reductase [Serratia microhaemolytica]|uniref:dTDP-4-dehydrorhamnose reductase n=1 Tax=Serratia microhaemolytica TaxID=2675110 RepID=UPI000FDDAE67|nr:dTDP-4-dehydrorhamnose reductase [Serratia microhaemolytica]
MKVLLTGGNGQLGRCFSDRTPIGWNVLATDAKTLDITDLIQVKNVVKSYRPNVIVNAAAYTAVDRAELEPELAALINETGPRNLALVANEVGARLVHISTDYVFDGEAGTPYIETAVTNPLNVYGKTKRDGEVAVKQIQPDALIIRTAWVFSEYGNNFVKTMLSLARQHNQVNVVSDQFGCPTYAGDIAQVIIELLISNTSGGVYHYCGDSSVSWSHFAKVIFSSAVQQGVLKYAPSVNDITTELYPTLAIRPKYSVLNCGKIEEKGIHLSKWRRQVAFIITSI